VKGNKLLLLLDGLDEVRQESRAKCVEAINDFRKEHGLTSLAVCSRSQDYTDLNSKLSFEGAIEVQPLTQKQITEFFNRFGKGMAGIKQVLKKDNALREMAETPLFLSIMMLAYRDKQDVDILVSQDEKAQRKHLFDIYIERMFEHPRSSNKALNKLNIFRWASWLAYNMARYNQIPYLLENMQPDWLTQKKQMCYNQASALIVGLHRGLLPGIFYALTVWFLTKKIVLAICLGLALMFIVGLSPYLGLLLKPNIRLDEVIMKDVLWDWEKATKGLIGGIFAVLITVLIVSGITFIFFNQDGFLSGEFRNIMICAAVFAGLIGTVENGLLTKQIDQTTRPGQKISSSARGFLFTSLLYGLTWGLPFELVALLFGKPYIGLAIGLVSGTILGRSFGGDAIIQHYLLRLILARNNLLPWRLVPFLDHCVDLIFLRRVGGGYIFVHRLLMEHFAEMYIETPTSKGN
jgi:hypothetical protein